MVKRAIVDSRYSSKFLKDLKDAFANQTPQRSREQIVSIVKEIPFKLDARYSTAHIDDSEIAKINENDSVARDVTLRTIDFTEFLNYSCINNISNQITSDNTFFVGPKNPSREAALSTSVHHRHFNSANFANFFSILKDQITV